MSEHRTARPGLRMAAILGLGLAIAFPVAAADAVDSAHPAIRRYTSADGLPNDTLNSVRLDPQGYLWVGTQNGASRFNGRRFTSHDMPDPAQNYVRDILPLADGTVWFARQGGGPVLLVDGRMTAFDTVEGEPFGRVNALYARVEGTAASPVLYAARHSGAVARFDGTSWKKVPGPDPAFRVWKLTESSALGGGPQLLAACEKGLFALTDGAFVKVPLPAGAPSVPFNNILETRDGGKATLWLGSYGAGVLRLRDGVLTRFTASQGLVSDLVTSLATTEGRAGPTLWVGTRGGLSRIDGEQVRPVPLDGRPKEIYSLAAPPGHDVVWAGTRGNGLFRVRTGPWRTLDVTAGLPSDYVMSLLVDGPSLFLATNKGVAVFEGGRWRTLDPSNGLPGYEVPSVARTDDGSIWIATLGNGLARLRGKELATFDAAHGLPTDRLYSLLADGDGVLLGTDTGSLFRVDVRSGAVVKTITGLPRAEVLAMTRDEDGTVFAASRAGLVAVPRDGPPVVHRRAEGLPNDEVLAVAVVGTGKGRELWAGTRGGAARIALPIRAGSQFSAVPSMPVAVKGTGVTAIVSDAGGVFLGTQRGVVRLTSHPGGGFAAALFTTANGLPSNVCTGGSLRDAEGRIWIATTGGVAIFDARETVTAPPPARPLVLERLLVNGEEREASPGLKLAHDQSSLTIELALLSYGEEGPHYRTQLVGLEKAPGAWTQETVLNLPHVPPGRHLLRVWARDAGVESGPIDWPFEVLPPPWLTAPAFIAYAATILAALAAGFRLRTAALRRHNQELSALVEEKTRDLRAARDQALAGSQTKSAFLANVSHELRTPLNAILGYAEMLVEDLATQAPHAVSDLERIQSSARHQLGLVNELLDLSKIEAGRFELHVTRFPVRALLEDVAATARPLVASGTNELTVEVGDGLESMSSDETRLRQVLLNLVANASKFTSKGRITLQARVDGDDVCFVVADTGVGMTPEQIARLFQPFMQADAQTSAVYGGTGLGLVIAQRFCELMGGGLTVASTPGRGSTFTARVPLEVKPPSSPALRRPAPGRVEVESRP